MIHQETVEKYSGTLAELAEDIGNLKYDALAEFLRLLSLKIEQDSVKDASRGRHKLAVSLQECAKSLGHSSAAIERAWQICEPYMRNN
jgi:hypothetical protein